MSGGGVNFTPLLSRERLNVARRGRRRSKALNKKVPKSQKNFLRKVKGRVKLRSKVKIGYSAPVVSCRLSKLQYAQFVVITFLNHTVMDLFAPNKVDIEIKVKVKVIVRSFLTISGKCHATHVL